MTESNHSSNFYTNTSTTSGIDQASNTTVHNSIHRQIPHISEDSHHEPQPYFSSQPHLNSDSLDFNPENSSSFTVPSMNCSVSKKVVRLNFDNFIHEITLSKCPVDTIYLSHVGCIKHEIKVVQKLIRDRHDSPIMHQIASQISGHHQNSQPHHPQPHHAHPNFHAGAHFYHHPMYSSYPPRPPPGHHANDFHPNQALQTSYEAKNLFLSYTYNLLDFNLKDLGVITSTTNKFNKFLPLSNHNSTKRHNSDSPYSSLDSYHQNKLINISKNYSHHNFPHEIKTPSKENLSNLAMSNSASQSINHIMNQQPSFNSASGSFNRNYGNQSESVSSYITLKEHPFHHSIGTTSAGAGTTGLGTPGLNAGVHAAGNSLINLDNSLNSSSHPTQNFHFNLKNSFNSNCNLNVSSISVCKILQDLINKMSPLIVPRTTILSPKIDLHQINWLSLDHETTKTENYGPGGNFGNMPPANGQHYHGHEFHQHPHNSMNLMNSSTTNLNLNDIHLEFVILPYNLSENFKKSHSSWLNSQNSSTIFNTMCMTPKVETNLNLEKEIKSNSSLVSSLQKQKSQIREKISNTENYGFEVKSSVINLSNTFASKSNNQPLTPTPGNSSYNRMLHTPNSAATSKSESPNCNLYHSPLIDSTSAKSELVISFISFFNQINLLNSKFNILPPNSVKPKKASSPRHDYQDNNINSNQNITSQNSKSGRRSSNQQTQSHNKQTPTFDHKMFDAGRDFPAKPGQPTQFVAKRPSNTKPRKKSSNSPSQMLYFAADDTGDIHSMQAPRPAKSTNIGSQNEHSSFIKPNQINSHRISEFVDYGNTTIDSSNVRYMRSSSQTTGASGKNQGRRSSNPPNLAIQENFEPSSPGVVLDSISGVAIWKEDRDREREREKDRFHKNLSTPNAPSHHGIGPGTLANYNISSNNSNYNNYSASKSEKKAPVLTDYDKFLEDLNRHNFNWLNKHCKNNNNNNKNSRFLVDLIEDKIQSKFNTYEIRIEMPVVHHLPSDDRRNVREDHTKMNDYHHNYSNSAEEKAYFQSMNSNNSQYPEPVPPSKNTKLVDFYLSIDLIYVIHLVLNDIVNEINEKNMCNLNSIHENVTFNNNNSNNTGNKSDPNDTGTNSSSQYESDSNCHNITSNSQSKHYKKIDRCDAQDYRD